MKIINSEHIVYRNCSECQNKKQFVYTTCSELGIFMYWTCTSMNNILSYYGLVDARISTSEKDLPLLGIQNSPFEELASKHIKYQRPWKKQMTQFNKWTSVSFFGPSPMSFLKFFSVHHVNNLVLMPPTFGVNWPDTPHFHHVTWAFHKCKLLKD